MIYNSKIHCKKLVKKRFVKYHFLSKISCCVNESQIIIIIIDINKYFKFCFKLFIYENVNPEINFNTNTTNILIKL